MTRFIICYIYFTSYQSVRYSQDLFFIFGNRRMRHESSEEESRRKETEKNDLARWSEQLLSINVINVP